MQDIKLGFIKAFQLFRLPILKNKLVCLVCWPSSDIFILRKSEIEAVLKFGKSDGNAWDIHIIKNDSHERNVHLLVESLDPLDAAGIEITEFSKFPDLDLSNLPDSLRGLIERRLWPSSVNEQELNPILGEKYARQFAPDCDRIILMPAPIHTIGDEVRDGNIFWCRDVSITQNIDLDKALIIADFGIGSDSPIILYYHDSVKQTVMFLNRSGNGKTIRYEWMETHASFDEFADSIDLSAKLSG